MLLFDPIFRVWVLNNGVEDTPMQQFSLSTLCSFYSIFLIWLYYSGTVWIDDQLHNFVETICFTVYQGNRKKTLSHFSWERLQREKSFLNNMNLINSNYHWKNWVNWLSTKWRKCVSLKGFHFEKNDPKVTKHVPLNFLTTFHKSFIYHGWLGQHGLCSDTNMRTSFLNSRLSF